MKNFIKPYLIVGLYLFCLSGFGQCPAFPTGTSTVQGQFSVGAGGTGTLIITGVDTTALTVCTGTKLVAINLRLAQQVGFKICYKHQDANFDITKNTLPCTESSGVLSAGYTPGRYAIVVTGTQGAAPFYACKVVNVVDVKPPVFSISSCVTNSILLSLLKDPANNFTSYTIDWGAGAVGNQISVIPIAPTQKFPATTNRTYTGVTSATVKVTGNFTIGNQQNSPIITGCTTAAGTQTISLTTLAAPTITQVEVQDNKTVAITYKSQQNIVAEAVKRTNAIGVTPATYTGTGVTLKPATGVATSTLTVGGLDTQTPIIFNMKVTNTLCGTDTYGAIDIPTTVLKVEAQNNKNVLTWLPVTGTVRFEIWRTDLGLITSVGTSVLAYTDTKITCSQNYTYYVRAILNAPVTAGGGIIYSISQKLTVKAISTDVPAALTDVFVSIESGSTTLRWLKPTAFDATAKYIVVYRSEGGDAAGPYSRIDSIEYKGSTTYVDATTEDGKMYCYKLAYNNKCLNTSTLSKALCPIYLTLKGDNLVWTPYIQFSSGLREYQVKKKFINTSGVADSKNFQVGNNLGWKIDVEDPNDASQQVLFYIEATSNAIGGNSYVMKSNEVLYTKSARIFMPDIFTPNNDPANNTVSIMGLYLTKVIDAYIYDRWGNTIFYSNAFDNTWNGIIQSTNTPAPEGTYTYKIVVQDQVGNVLTKEGRLLLVR